jgi:putative flippase GtrA
MVLGVLVDLVAVSAGWANVAATAAGTVPSFELNRRWVWRKGGRRSLPVEVLPFTILSFTGLAISTIAVHVAGGWASARGWTSTGRTFLVMATNAAAYGALWILQFVLLDRVLFRPRPPGRVERAVIVGVDAVPSATIEGCPPGHAGRRRYDTSCPCSVLPTGHVEPSRGGRCPGQPAPAGPD